MGKEPPTLNPAPRNLMNDTFWAGWFAGALVGFGLGITVTSLLFALVN